jgi:hypothetical protein
MAHIEPDRKNTVTINGKKFRPITLRVSRRDEYPAKGLSFLEEAEYKGQAMSSAMHELSRQLEEQVRIEQEEDPEGKTFETHVKLVILKPIKNG